MIILNDFPTVDQRQVEHISAEAREVLAVEAKSILKLQEAIDDEFVRLVKLILKSQGRIILIGVGKSGLIARKIAATLSSTGSPSFFVHAGEASHGDLGMITEEDIVIAISNSGETEEVLALLSSIKRIGAHLVALTGQRDSTLAKYSDIVIFSGVEEEACPHGLAPTASTTAAMALGDALAIALSSLRGFTPEDFALYHPGGNLGRRLLTRVKDVLEIRGQNPVVGSNTTVKETLFTMTDSKMGSASVVDQGGLLIGIITDGDIRRHLEKSSSFLERPVAEVMTSNPTTISGDKLASEALRVMEEKEINDLPVVEEGRPVGMLNFQDLLRAKIF